MRPDIQRPRYTGLLMHQYALAAQNAGGQKPQHTLYSLYYDYTLYS